MTHTLWDAMPLALQAMALSMARAVGCSLFLPSWGRRHMSSMHRNAICLAVSLPQAMAQWEFLMHQTQWVLHPMLMVFKEVLVGGLLGALLSIPFWIFRGAFTLVDNQRGANAAQMNNPSMEADSSLLGEWVERLLLVFLVETGGFLWVFEALSESYLTWPLTSTWPLLSEQVTTQVLAAYARLMMDVLLLASPLLLLLLAIEFGMAIGSTAVQGIDVYQTAMPIKSLAALIFLAVSVNQWFQHIMGRFEFWWVEGVVKTLGLR